MATKHASPHRPAAAPAPKKRRAAKRSLKDYKAKRDFKKTPEPSGDTAPNLKTERERFFCVQKHLASHLHYDFRLEHNGVLLSWAVPKGPSLKPGDKRLAMAVEDHPFDYGEFEGVIPEGYGAGIVMLWDVGTWTPQGDVDEGLRKGELKFSLDGVKLKGSWAMVRIGKSKDDKPSRTWLLLKHRDDWAGDIDITTFAPLSVKSNGDFPDILAQKNPDIWKSHMPEKGGAAGAMLREIITKAAAIKAGARSGKAKAKRAK